MAETAGDVLVQTLVHWGVSVVFGMPGDGVNGIIDALRRRQDDIAFVLTRHEEAAALAACGYARTTGRLGVCLATSGPGGLHLLNGLYDAKADGQPVLAVTGMQYHDLIGTYAQQDVALDHVFSDVAVYSARVMGPAHMETIAELACRAALSRRGVAHVTVPLDIQLAPIGRGARPARHATRRPPETDWRPATPPAEDQVRRAAAVLNAGARVAILAGRGALGARAELLAVAERLAAPVAEALLGKGVLPHDSPYSAGGLGLLGTRPAQDCIEGCDTLLIVGSGFPYLEYYPRPGQARVVQIDTDPLRIGLRTAVEAPLVGDAAAALAALLPHLQPHEDTLFLESTQASMEEWREDLEQQATRGDTPMKPQLVTRELDQLLPDNAIVCSDNGTCTTWAARFIRMRGEMQFAVSGTLATTGCALPYAIGAAVAYPDRPVIALVGDGGLSMSLAELATCAKYRLNVKIVVIRNDMLGEVKWEQLAFLGTHDYGTDLHPVDFAAVARAVGVPAFTVERPEECSELLGEALATAGPVLIEALVDPNEPPMPPKATLTQAAHMADLLARRTPNRRKLALTLASDTVRQVV